MGYAKGDRVIHPGKKEWGLGEVLEDEIGGKVKVFFVESGEKNLNLDYAQLEKVKREPHPILDNLKPSAKGHKGKRHYIEGFLKLYPMGFRDEKYLNDERNYKLEACEFTETFFNQKEFEARLGVEDYEGICDRIFKVVNKTNLIFPNEKMGLKDGLKDTKAQRLFSESLFQLLYGDRKVEDRFNSFIQCLTEIDATKWTIATYFLYLKYPKEHMFLKPEATKGGADAFSFDLKYKSELNWLTYESLLKFSNYLFEELSELEPKDMIDVQSFIWCADQIYNKRLL